MPCKIQIEKNLTEEVDRMSLEGLSYPLEEAEKVAKKVNNLFNANVVRFYRIGDIVDRSINIPKSLIDKYYDNEKRLEEQEARKIQQEDAARAGVEYTDEYLFGKEEREEPSTIAKGEKALQPKTEKRKDFVILNNALSLNLSEKEIEAVYENYVNLMDRKREGKAIDRAKFDQVFKNLQVFKSKNTYIFGEWDSKNNVFKGRLMSSPGIKELYTELDVLLENVNFMASVPSDIGKMLEKKGLYKLNVDKPYNFRGEDMIKNLYFTNKDLVEKVFKKLVDKITYEEVVKYDSFFNYWSLIKKLKDAYDEKDFDKLFPLLKEIGIYDYNAYRLVKKVKRADITNEDINNVVQEVIKNSAVNRVNIDKTDLFNNPEIYNELNNELNKTLATYLSKFGIETKLLNDLQTELGIDSLAHLDILNKIIYINKNNQKDYPQQAGKIIAYMMQHNPLVQEITSNMSRLSMFKNLKKEELLEAVGDLISKELHKKTDTKVPTSLLLSIRALIRQFFDFLNEIKLQRINRNIAIIADNILIQNQSLITQSLFKPGAVGDKVSLVSLKEALSKDNFAKSIVDKLSEYFILTGSVTLAEQGTIYRPEENQVHDLDWVSSFPREESVKLFESLYQDAVYIRNIKGDDYQTDTWVVPQEGYKINNLVFVENTNKIQSYDVVDKDGNIVNVYNGLMDTNSNSELAAKMIDIFSYDVVTEEKTKNIEITLESGKRLKIADWRNTFRAKLEFGRLKDIWDYNRFIPKKTEEVTPKLEEPKTPIKPGVEELFESNPELANAVYEALEYSYTGEYSPAFLYESGIKASDGLGYVTYKVKVNNKGNKYLTSLDKTPNTVEKNMGVKAYYKFIIENKGKNITTDNELSIAGRKVLEQLEKKGYVIKTDAKIIETKKSGAGYELDVYDKPLYEFTGKIPESYLTPQQKQQALQLYSQYLDTIFPDSKVKDIVYHGTDKKIEEEFIPKEKDAIFFTSHKTHAQRYAEISFAEKNNLDSLSDEVSGKGFVHLAIINITKPYYGDGADDIPSKTERKKKDYDGAINNDGPRKNVIGDIYEYAVFNVSNKLILGSKQDIQGFKEFVEGAKPATVSENNVIDPNYLLLLEEEQKQFKELQEEGLINKGLFNKNRDIVYSTDRLEELLKRLKDLAISWIKVEKLNTWNKVTIDVSNDKNPIISKSVDPNETQKKLLDKIKSITDRLGLKIERLDAIYEKQQEINTLTRQLESAKTEQEKQEISKKIDRLKEYGIKKEALAIADTLNGVIQLTTEDNIAFLSEEVIHFLVDIVEQKNPQLFKDLMQKVQTSEVFKQTKALYEGTPNYDEYQIKKEAIAKVLVNYLITNETQENEYQNNKFENNFWQKIKSWAGSFFDSIINKDYKAFDAFLRDVFNSDYVSQEDRKYFSGKYYYALSTREEKRNKILEEKRKITKKEVNGVEKYFYDGKIVAQRVSDLVSQLMEKIFANRDTIKATSNSFALERGTKLHKIMENTFKKYVNEDTGELFSTPLESNQELKDMEKEYPEITKKADDYVKEVLGSFKDAYFLTEVPIINNKKTLAGTIDLLVIDKEGKVHVFDWKSIKAQRKVKETGSWEDITDIPWWKKRGWLYQLDEYAKMLYSNYDISRSEFGKIRAIPILSTEFDDVLKDVKFAPFVKEKMNLKERALIPVISQSELTGKKALDKLIQHLRKTKEELNNKIAKKQGQRELLYADLEYIDKIITDLIVAEDLGNMFSNILAVLNNAAKYLEDKTVIKKSTLTRDIEENQKLNDFIDSLKNKSTQEIADILLEIEDLRKSLSGYITYEGRNEADPSLLEQISSVIIAENPSVKQEVISNIRELNGSLSFAVANFQYMKEVVTKEFGSRYNVSGVQDLDREASIIDVVIDKVSSLYSQRTKVGKLVGEIFRKVDHQIRKKDKATAERFQKLRSKKLKGIVTNVSKTFGNMIKKVTVTINDEEFEIYKLIPKIKKEFYKDHEETLKKFQEGLNKNSNFFQSKEYKEILDWIDENVNVDKWSEYYNKRKEEYESYIRDIVSKSNVDFPDQEIKDKMSAFELNNNIYKSPRAFKRLSSTKFINEEKWESDEYKKIKKDPVDLEIYNYFKYLNQKAISLGYLDNQGEATFIPFQIPVTDKVKSPYTYLSDYITSKQIDDAQNLETSFSLSEVEEKTLKKPFTRETVLRGKVPQQLDLFLVFEKFEQSLNEYEELRNSEKLINTIVELEKNKKSEVPIGKPLITQPKSSDADYERLRKLVNYRLYGEKYGRDISIGNISLLKSINVLSNYGSTLFLSIYWKVALSAYGGSSVIALSKSTKAYKRKNLLFSSINPTESDLFNVFSNSKAIKKAFDYRIKSIEKEEINLKRSNTFKNLAVFGWKYAANTLEVVDEKIQDDVFFAALRSHYVINNKIINLEDIKEQISPNYYENENENDKKLKAYLKDKKLLVDWVKENLKDNKLDISSLDEQSVFDFNSLLKGTIKEIVGNMSSEDYNYMRIGLIANLVSKFKVWTEGVLKGIYSDINYNRETKTATIGALNSFLSVAFSGILKNAFLSKEISRKDAVYMGLSLLVPFVTKNRLNQYLRVKYKKYVKEGKELGYDVEISENQFVEIYKQKSKSFLNAFLMLGVLYIINAIAGGDDDQEQTYPERLLEESSEGAIREIKSAFTPWGAIKIVTTLAVPAIGALGEALQPFFNLLVGISHWDHIMLEVYSAIGAQEKEIETQKRIYKKKTIGAQFTKDALDAIPFARNINRELVVPYFEEWRNYLGVDKEYRERR